MARLLRHRMTRVAAASAIALAVFGGAVAGCKTGLKTGKTGGEGTKVGGEIILATTTSTADTGLLDVLLPAFTKKTGTQVKPIAVGSGEAFKMGIQGEADVLLVHAPADEESFVAAGFGMDRKPVMYNYFVVVGPKNDPAGIKGLTSAAEALKRIAAAKATFVSRGDDSGTNKKELKLWKGAGIEPKGSWYVDTGQGMGETLRIASEKKGYTLSDTGTYIATKESLQLVALVEKNKDLLNAYSVIVINPKKFPKVNVAGTRAFAQWITSAEGQDLIGRFGVEKFGAALFTPDAETGPPGK